MARTRTDILVAGGGIAGLTAAAACAHAGHSVTLVSPDTPVTEPAADGSDLRSTAFLQPAVALFDKIGLWSDLGPQATALDGLRIVDSIGWPPEVRTTREFQSTDISDQPFGWNLLNWQTLGRLVQSLERHKHVDLCYGTAFKSMVQRDREVIVTLTNGDSIAARLVVAADGRNSAVRAAAGIDVATTRYGQKALAFVVGHAIPHENVSTEIYNEGGPFTMVPLPDQDGQPASAIVWMNPSAKALELADLPDADFAAHASERSCHWLGPMTLKSPRRIWPIISQRAQALTAPRVALLAEAAHVVPPIGAQGLNTSLNDIAALMGALTAHPGDPGADTVLATYRRARTADIRARVAAIDLFNRVTKSGTPWLQSLRLNGLKLVHDAAPLRRSVMRAGIGG
ncbi:FAD-dependent monooxygenase [Actibacterium sp. 188UL27-1]|uniref:FAD-dependent monooxygenase n=1 Tax=Actibacterium sp. 188UL27-1 TaxID=2786961 RepID=UPI00195BE236|nr:FAD-dependent monooxygenase [Actibacterium sp. 188UL27-1]MBM7068179.1 FAD-dependent monooxygenase [Actibacterium sp. 188UL27-1]